MIDYDKLSQYGDGVLYEQISEVRSEQRQLNDCVELVEGSVREFMISRMDVLDSRSKMIERELFMREISRSQISMGDYGWRE